MNDGSKTVENRFLLAAIVCAVLLIVNYFALVGTPWGRQFDRDAFLGRKMLGREIITFDSHILKLVRKRTLFLGAVATLAIAVMRRCTFVGVIAVAAFGCAVVGAVVLKRVLPCMCWSPMTQCSTVAFRPTHIRADTRPLLLRLR
jgi:hypothetical protein